MVKINRDYVLKTFLDKVREAKRQDMKEVKIPIRFLDDLAYIIVQLMSEELSRAFEAIDGKPKEEFKPTIPINKKVLKTITPKKLEDIKEKVEEQPIIKEPEPIKSEVKPVEEPVKSFEEQPVVYKPIEQPKVEPIAEEQEEDEEDDDDNTNIMYGGTW